MCAKSSRGPLPRLPTTVSVIRIIRLETGMDNYSLARRVGGAHDDEIVYIPVKVNRRVCEDLCIDDLVQAKLIENVEAYREKFPWVAIFVSTVPLSLHT